MQEAFGNRSARDDEDFDDWASADVHLSFICQFFIPLNNNNNVIIMERTKKEEDDETNGTDEDSSKRASSVAGNNAMLVVVVLFLNWFAMWFF